MECSDPSELDSVELYAYDIAGYDSYFTMGRKRPYRPKKLAFRNKCFSSRGLKDHVCGL